MQCGRPAVPISPEMSPGRAPRALGRPRAEPPTTAAMLLGVLSRWLLLLCMVRVTPAGLGGTGVGTAAAATSHAKWFSFYGSDAAGQRGITNVQLNVFPGTVGNFSFAAIDAAKAQYNMTSFIDVEGFVWKGRSGVAPGWQAKITATVAAASTRLASGVVAGLFLGDEIVCAGVPVANLSAVANFCKQTLTAAGHGSSLVYVNECTGSFQPGTFGPGTKVPAGLDIISFDQCE